MPYSYTSGEILSQIYPPRPAAARKYDYGSLLIIGGNFMYTGAPALAALGALRAGVDVVTLAAPVCAADIAASYSPSLITFPLHGDFLCEAHLDALIKLTKNKDALVIGPGLGREEKTLEAVRKIVEKINLPLVVDADGIYAFAKVKAKVQKAKVIFTPHIRELEVLYGKKINDESLDSKIKIAKETAKRLEAVILLKGSVDIITDGASVTLNKTGSPYMTSGGTGDVLAGITGAIAAQLHARSRYDPLLTASASAYISGRAGEHAARKFKDALIATDVIEEIPVAIARRR